MRGVGGVRKKMREGVGEIRGGVMEGVGGIRETEGGGVQV